MRTIAISSIPPRSSPHPSSALPGRGHTAIHNVVILVPFSQHIARNPHLGLLVQHLWIAHHGLTDFRAFVNFTILAYHGFGSYPGAKSAAADVLRLCPNRLSLGIHDQLYMHDIDPTPICELALGSWLPNDCPLDLTAHKNIRRVYLILEYQSDLVESYRCYFRGPFPYLEDVEIVWQSGDALEQYYKYFLETLKYLDDETKARLRFTMRSTGSALESMKSWNSENGDGSSSIDYQAIEAGWLNIDWTRLFEEWDERTKKPELWI